MSEKYPRIAVINTGWSDDYQTDEVRGNFGYLANGVGHEKYNFLPDSKGRYYAYTPPLGEQQSPPMPIDPKDWLVFAVSKWPGKSGLYLVGWYEGADFVRGYSPRPDADRLGTDSDGGRFSYTLRSDRAYPIPQPLRDRKIVGDHIKRSYAYLRGNGSNDSWRADVAKQLLLYREEFLGRLAGIAGTEDERARLQFCGDPKRRRDVETEAVKAVKQHFKDWSWETKEAEKCGYDLLFTHPETRDEMHVEVKGTAMDRPHFFLTRNEYEYGRKLAINDRRSRANRAGNLRPLWKLATVHDVYGKADVTIHTFREMEQRFDISPYAWHATLRKI